MSENVETAGSIEEFSGAEIFGVSIVFVIWLAFAIFFFGFFWKMIRAQLRMPEELAGIRAALERIAERLERDR